MKILSHFLTKNLLFKCLQITFLNIFFSCCCFIKWKSDNFVFPYQIFPYIVSWLFHKKSNGFQMITTKVIWRMRLK